MSWKEIKQFKSRVPLLPPTLLPHELRDHVFHTSSRMGIPPESMAASSLVGLSSLLGRKFGIFPNANGDDWVEYANLWGLVVGRPSLKKSSTVEQAITPLLTWEKEKNDQYESGMSIRDIQRIGTPLLTKAEDIKTALDGLEQKNWLKVHY